MGWLKKAFKKIAHVATLGAYRGGSGGGSGGGVIEAPAPEIELNQKDEGEAKQKEETTKIKVRKGKRALKITKDNAPATGAGRNIV